VACEKWLALDNENHDQFAAAMMLCQDPSGSCMRTGICTFEGDCLRTDFAAYRQAARMIRNLAGDQSSMVQSALAEAAGHMETMALACKGART
jgi:hypothetical protein